MKKYLLLLTVSFSFLLAKSQGRNHLYVSGGYTSPINTFKAAEGTNGGYATEGYGLNVGFNRDFKRFYVGAQFSALTNGFDEGKYNEVIRNQRGENSTSTTSHTGYGLVAANVVIGYNFYKKSTLSIGGHLKPGIGAFIVDDLENVSNGSSGEIQVSHEGFVKSTVVFGAGLQLQKRLDKNFGLIAGIDYVFRNITEETSYKRYVNTNIDANDTRDVNMEYGNILYSIGVSYTF